MAGHLLYESVTLDNREKRELSRAVVDHWDYLDPCAKYTWVFDTLRFERWHKKSENICVRSLESSRRNIFIIDAPGDPRHIKNLTRGCSLADAAILVIDASVGGFESGYSSTGSTREHVILA